jgi:LmbE family N-acetylglucosaminyl deacetylase
VDLSKDDTYSVLPMPEDLRQPYAGRALCFAPHPDDECAGPGGALCMHRMRGDPVRVVIVTTGAAGDPDGKYDRDTYVEQRYRESRAAMGTLGVEDLVFWDLPDSCVIADSDITGVAIRAAREVEAFRPEVVYLPWEGEANSDHRAVYCGGLRGLRRCEVAGIALGYELWGLMVPDVVLDITPVAERKFAALKAFETQLAYVDYLHSVRGQNAHRSVIYNKGRGYAEAVRRVRV